MEVLSRAEILIPKLAMMYALTDEFSQNNYLNQHQDRLLTDPKKLKINWINLQSMGGMGFK